MTIVVDHPDRMHDGVYLGLEESRYHAAFALSSHGIGHLRVSGLDYWMHTQALNPDYQSLVTATETEAMLIGRAYDTRIIEGHEAFDRRFAAKLDPRDWPTAVRTKDDLLLAIADAGGPTAGMKNKLKGELIKILAQHDPKALIWETIESGHAAANDGKILLPAEIVHRIEIAAQMIEHHPDISKAFTGGIPQPSIFWTDPRTGIPCKARFDYWKPHAIVDLKSYEATGMPLDRAINRAFVRYRYDVQAALYLRAREEARLLIQNGLVFGEADPELIAALAAAEEATMLFVWQCKGPAPVVRGKVLLANSGTLYVANTQIDESMLIWARYWETCGVDPWIEESPITTWSDEDFFFPMR